MSGIIQKSNNPGILDFQDALVGPITYDLVSLLKDAYIEWDEEIVLDHAVRYWEKAKSNNLIANLEFSTFYKDFHEDALRAAVTSSYNLAPDP